MTLSPTQCNFLTIPRGSWGKLYSLKVTVNSKESNKYTFTAERAEMDLLGPLTISGTFSRLNDLSNLDGTYKYKTGAKDSRLEEGGFEGLYDEDKKEWRLRPTGYAFDVTWALSRKID